MPQDRDETTETVALTFRIPAEEHQDLKVTAALARTPMGEVVREAIRSHLAQLKATLEDPKSAVNG